MSYLPPFLQRWLSALDSGWRAGMKQYRSMRTKQKRAMHLDDPFAS